MRLPLAYKREEVAVFFGRAGIDSRPASVGKLIPFDDKKMLEAWTVLSMRTHSSHGKDAMHRGERYNFSMVYIIACCCPNVARRCRPEAG